MNPVITHINTRRNLESMAQISSMLSGIDHTRSPMRETMEKIGADVLRQQAQMNKLLAPTIQAVEAMKASQANLPDFSATLKALELVKRSAVVNVDIFPTANRRSYRDILSPEPQVKRREPKLSAEEIVFVKDLMEKKEDQSIQLITEQVTSVFNWDTFDLHIEGRRIKLEATEKLICMSIFKNPNTRCMLLDNIEETVYGEIVPGSKKLKQAIKRINTKIRLAGFDNLFTYGEGFLNVNI